MGKNWRLSQGWIARSLSIRSYAMRELQHDASPIEVSMMTPLSMTAGDITTLRMSGMSDGLGWYARELCPPSVEESGDL
jgi:hypothetical protein